MSDTGGSGPDHPHKPGGLESFGWILSSGSSPSGSMEMSPPAPTNPSQQQQQQNKRGGNLPHQIEAERSVLGAILLQNEAIDKVQEIGLTPEDFYLETHRRVFETSIQLAERREPVDLVTLTAALRERGLLERIGGSAALAGLVEDGFALANVAHYARIVKDKATVRRVMEACQIIIGEAVEGVPDTESFLDEAERKIFAIGDVRNQKAFVELKNILMSNVAQIEELALKGEDVTGLSTGFHAFDRLTTGLHPGQVVVIAARPGMGKTSWFLSALQHAAAANKAVAAVFSLEMSKEEMGFRFLSGMSRIDSRRLKTGKLAERDWRKLAEAADRLSKSKIFIDDTPAVTVLDIRSRCRRLMAMEKKLDLIVVDYLQLMQGTRGARGESNREREIAEISRGLKQLAKELKVPIIALSQLNRGVESRQDKRPTLADLRESGAIEQDADMVCFIHREDYYNKDTEEKGIAEFIIAKNRAGETSTVRLAWLGQYTLFANLAEDEPGTPVSSGRPDRGDITL